MSDTDQVYAQNQPTSPTSDYNALRFAMQTAQNATGTCMIVKVLKVSKDGEGQLKGVGRVDVQPLVQMVDGIGKTTDHGTIFNLPYLRMIGGKDAVIIDPKEGDIGLIVITDRDSSGVKESMDVSPPGSKRKYNPSDGFFLGSVLSEDPERYIRWVEEGIQISTDNEGTTSIWIKPGEIHLTADKGPTSLYVTPTRIDLGMKGAPHAVLTVDGPSQKVFAVIDEEGPEDHNPP